MYSITKHAITSFLKSPTHTPCCNHSQDSYATEKALAWLTAAHAEERALRSAARAEAAEVVGQLARERNAHQAAVEKLVAEMEERAKLGLEIQGLHVSTAAVYFGSSVH